MNHRDMLDSGCLLRLYIQSLFYILGHHGLTQSPGEDIPGIIIHHSGKIVPAPINHFEIAKICLPELVDSSCGILELIFGRNNGVDRRCYQIIGFEDAVDTALLNEILHCVSYVTSYFSAGFFRILLGHLHHPLSFPFGNSVPNLLGAFITTFKAIKPMFLITFIPFVERSFLGFPFSQGSV
jgi:hypothetical protein